MAVTPTSSATGQGQRAVTPHASNNLPDGVCRALYINDVGTVAVSFVARDDTDPLTRTVVGPCEILMSVKAVRVSGTTATSIHAIY